MLRKVISPKVKINVVLSAEENRRMADFFVVMIAVDGRLRKTKSAKKKNKVSKDSQKEIGLSRMQAYYNLSSLTTFFGSNFNVLNRW